MMIQDFMANCLSVLVWIVCVVVGGVFVGVGVARQPSENANFAARRESAGSGIFVTTSVSACTIGGRDNVNRGDANANIAAKSSKTVVVVFID